MQVTIENEYFNWLGNIVCGYDRFRLKSYHELLNTLHNIEFIWHIPNDENRAEEGISLRARFAYDIGYSPNTIYTIMGWPCSVLEMMVALAVRCEENIMDDPAIGNRTTQWFWGMIRSLGLLHMYDNFYDDNHVRDTIYNFLDRQYSRTGEGGLFTIKNCTSDLRNVEIWHQLCWYLDNLEGY